MRSGGGQTPRNACFTGLSAVSTFLITSESGRSPAGGCFRAGAETGAAKSDKNGGTALGTILGMNNRNENRYLLIVIFGFRRYFTIDDK